jgi:hypothetical protein
MRPLLVAALLVLLSVDVEGQKIRFTDTSNVWQVGSTYWTQAPNFSTTYYEYRYSGDTSYGGLDYSILPDAIFGVTYVMREDTLVNKVYYRLLNSSQPGADTNEYVAFDYNLVLGDTFLVRAFQGTNTCTVVDFDSVLIQNVYHKYWELIGPLLHLRIVEGIGNLFTPTRHFNPNVGTAIPFVYCFSHRNTIPPIINTIGIFNNVSSCIVGVTDPKGENSFAFPNPVTGSSQLKVAGISKGNIVIWNALGQEVYRQKFANLRAIPVGEYLTVPGMYYYRIIDQSQPGLNIYKGSFIRE